MNQINEFPIHKQLIRLFVLILDSLGFYQTKWSLFWAFSATSSLFFSKFFYSLGLLFVPQPQWLAFWGRLRCPKTVKYHFIRCWILRVLLSGFPIKWTEYSYSSLARVRCFLEFISLLSLSARFESLPFYSEPNCGLFFCFSYFALPFLFPCYAIFLSYFGSLRQIVDFYLIR